MAEQIGGFSDTEAIDFWEPCNPENREQARARGSDRANENDVHIDEVAEVRLANIAARQPRKEQWAKLVTQIR